jgi:hypothetical protein
MVVVPSKRRLQPYRPKVMALNVLALSLLFCCFQFRLVSMGASVDFYPPTESDTTAQHTIAIAAATKQRQRPTVQVDKKKKGLALGLVRSVAKNQLEMIAEASAPLSSSNPVPAALRDRPLSPVHKIPHFLIFTFKYNLLERQEPSSLLYYQNVQRTIQMYRDEWQEPEAPVWFLNDTDCRSAIHAVRPELLPYFEYERDGAWRADMCRIAALYLSGGYYFDVDMEVVQPFVPSNSTSFVTVKADAAPGDQKFFQSFLASAPKSRILEQALEEMLEYYRKQRTHLSTHLMGPETLKWAFDMVPEHERGKVRLLKESGYHVNSTVLNLPQSRRNAVGAFCNFLVQDPDTLQTHFYSRIVGIPKKCMDGNSPEGRAYVEKLNSVN